MSRTIVFAADLEEIIARTVPRPGIRWATEADSETLSAISVSTAWQTGLDNNDARLAVAEQGGTIVAYLICTTASPIRQYPWLLVNLRIGHDYMTLGAFVVPHERGRRLIGDIKGFAARHFVSEGYRRNVSAARSDNRPSLKAHASIGAEPLVSLWHARTSKLGIVGGDHRLPHITWGNRRPFVISV